MQQYSGFKTPLLFFAAGKTLAVGLMLSQWHGQNCRVRTSASKSSTSHTLCWQAEWTAPTCLVLTWYMSPSIADSLRCHTRYYGHIYDVSYPSRSLPLASCYLFFHEYRDSLHPLKWCFGLHNGFDVFPSNSYQIQIQLIGGWVLIWSCTFLLTWKIKYINSHRKTWKHGDPDDNRQTKEIDLRRNHSIQ
jgi:hypothetical protein